MTQPSKFTNTGIARHLGDNPLLHDTRSSRPTARDLHDRPSDIIQPHRFRPEHRNNRRAGLDDILGGGLIKGGLYLIEGMAGAGKTILSTQIGFHRVAEGDPVLYITLIAESHSKLLSHLKGLSFYNADAISDKMLFVSGYHELMCDGLNGFLALIASTIKTSRPRFMVIDGFRSAREN